ncbi:ATP-binding protein [Streptomyces sp. NPDC056257]|uniref:ATP-binding protein n=1 Tax=Streptomyces sp. NPDC056257 TaxID=3345765 RepID=UPI0035D94964
MSEEPVTYDGSDIQVLEGSEAIRKRPGMYIGSTGERGLHELVYAVVGRAVNEVLAGRAGSVEVVLTPDGGVRVTDDGPGIPVEAAGDAGGGPGLEALLTRPHAGAEPGGRHAVPMSMFGTGLCVANALSSRLTAEVRRTGVRWVQEYERGVALTPPVVAGPATGTGTTIAFWPDAGIFGTATQCSYAVLAEHFRELAFLNRRMDISLTDARTPGRSRPVRFHFPGGARDFLAYLVTRRGTPVAPAHSDVFGFECEWEDVRMAATAEVALHWYGSGEERIEGFANSRPTPDGGTHVDGIRDGVVAAVNAYARQHRLLTSADPDLGADRIGEGLTAVVSVKLDRPEFKGATNGRLGGAVVRVRVGQAVRDRLGAWLEQDPERAAALIGRIVRGTLRDCNGGSGAL